MKPQLRFVSTLMLCVALAVTACDTGKKDNNNNLLLMLLAGGGPSDPSDPSGPSAGDKETCTIDGVSFAMAYVPGGLTFPTGVSDDGDIDSDGAPEIDPTATVNNDYWIGETEVTYELWKKVYDWATISAGYTFANPGVLADGSPQKPVLEVNWRSAMVWCNALTEWYNAKNGTNYTCVYYTDATYTIPHKDSTDGTYNASVNPNNGGFDKPYIMAAASGNMSMDLCTATGFRLLTPNEWECAARYRDGTLWTYGDHVSGDETGYCWSDGTPLGGMPLSTVFGNYAVYFGNSGSQAVVKSLGDDSANALGLFDMSGNMSEWCFDWHPDYVGSYRVHRGGRWDYTAEMLPVGLYSGGIPYAEDNFIGFRFARSQ